MDKVERVGHRLLERAPEREPGGDRRRERAAGPVGRRRVDARMGEAAHSGVVHEDVDDRRRVGQVPAFHQRGARTQRDERAPGPLHLIGRSHLAADENLRLVQIRRHE